MAIPTMVQMEAQVQTKLGRTPSRIKIKNQGPSIESKLLFYDTPSGLFEYAISLFRYEKLNLFAVDLVYAPPYLGSVEKAIDDLSVLP